MTLHCAPVPTDGSSAAGQEAWRQPLNTIDLVISGSDGSAAIPSVGMSPARGDVAGNAPAASFEEKALAHHQFALILVRDLQEPDGYFGSQSSTAWELQRAGDGVWSAVFDRPAATFKDALGSALAEIRSNGWTVVRIAPDDLVTQAEIADRLGRTSESVRLLSSGRRGNRSFPPPAVRVTNRGTLWRWSQVAAWARLPVEEVERASWIAAANAILDMAQFNTPDEQRILREVGDLLGSTKPSSGLIAP